jgi:hypothetical protein
LVDSYKSRRTILFRFLGKILRALRLEVSE